jgi:proteic killer suppression protein
LIESIRHRALRRFAEKGDRSGLPAERIEKIENILSLLDAAISPQDLDLPGLGLHPLKGELKGFWSVTVSANWRIVFRFEDGNAQDVDLTDYH